MREFCTTLFVFAAAFMLWRAFRPHRGLWPVHASDSPSQFPVSDTNAYKWPALGKFEFPVVESASHQPALKHVAETAQARREGAVCVAALHMGASKPHVYKPVEVRVDGQRVAFLSSGDASRFQRRLAYEGRAGQTTLCDALVVSTIQGGRTVYDLRLDLKEFRH